MVEINNLTTVSIDTEFLEKIVQGILKEEVGREKQVSLAFVGPGRMKQINKRYRKKNRVTDVLSFPESKLDFDNFSIKGFLKEKDSIGEIVICLKEIKKNAKRYKVDFKAELARVLIHGVLHLLGYDHEKSEEEAKKMQKKEEYYLSKFLKN